MVLRVQQILLVVRLTLIVINMQVVVTMLGVTSKNIVSLVQPVKPMEIVTVIHVVRPDSRMMVEVCVANLITVPQIRMRLIISVHR